MPKRITTRQLKELLEIDHAGDGIGEEIQVVIRRHRSGGVKGSKSSKKKAAKGGGPDVDIRTRQAKTLWDKGFGEVLGFKSFEQYLEAITEMPERPEDLPDHFQPILVDQRIFRSEELGGLVKVCELLGVTFNGDNTTFEPHNPEHVVKDSVYWMWCQDGKQNQGKSVKACRTQFTKASEIGLSAMEGLAILAQNPDVLNSHYMDLPSSVRSDGREHCAYLRLWSGGPGLGWGWGDGVHSGYGSASRWDC